MCLAKNISLKYLVYNLSSLCPIKLNYPKGDVIKVADFKIEHKKSKKNKSPYAFNHSAYRKKENNKISKIKKTKKKRS